MNGTIKREWPYLLAVTDPVELRAELKIVRTEYNSERLHSSIGYLTPDGGVSYLCLTPFGVGDTGFAATLLGIPLPLQFLALAIGVAGMFANARAFAPHLARHAGADQANRNAMSLFVWLYGMLASVLLSILYLAIAPMDISPGEQIAVIAAGTVILVFAPMANIFHRQVAAVAYEPLRLQPVPVVGLIVLALLVAGNILLSFGVQVG